MDSLPSELRRSGRVVVGIVAAWLGAKVVSVVADAVRKILNPVRSRALM
jgi:hypothetical protein